MYIINRFTESDNGVKQLRRDDHIQKNEWKDVENDPC
jgi:hypothetical protein